MARTLHLAAAADRETVKPEPPEDTMEKMAQALREMGQFAGPIPEEAVTRQQFADRIGLSLNQANRRMKRLMNAGLVKMVGRRGYDAYYVFTDVDGQRQPGPKSPR